VRFKLYLGFICAVLAIAPLHATASEDSFVYSRYLPQVPEGYDVWNQTNDPLGFNHVVSVAGGGTCPIPGGLFMVPADYRVTALSFWTQGLKHIQIYSKERHNNDFDDGLSWDLLVSLEEKEKAMVIRYKWQDEILRAEVAKLYEKFAAAGMAALRGLPPAETQCPLELLQLSTGLADEGEGSALGPEYDEACDDIASPYASIYSLFFL